MVAGGAVERRVHRHPVHALLVNIPMAVDAPSHRQALNLPNSLHRFHRAVAFLAYDARHDVGSVVEVDETGEVMHFNPLDRLWGSAFDRSELVVNIQGECIVDLLDLGRDNLANLALLLLRRFVFGANGAKSGRYESVAIHASPGGRNAGVTPLLGRRVAVLAVDIHLPRVKQMGEGDRLVGLVTLLIVGQVETATADGQHQDTSHDADGENQRDRSLSHDS